MKEATEKPMELIEIDGERREMVDKLLAQAAQLMYDNGRCYFQNCYGPAEAALKLSVSGSKASSESEFAVCHPHLQIISVIEETNEVEVLIGLLIELLDPERASILQEATPAGG